MGPKICSPRFQLRNSSRDRLFWRKSRQLRECWLAVWLLTIELGWRTVIYSRTKRHGSPNTTAAVRGWSRPRNAGQLLNRSLAAARDFSFAGHGVNLACSLVSSARFHNASRAFLSGSRTHHMEHFDNGNPVRRRTVVDDGRRVCT
jgi:hypothetical protein